MNFLLIVSSIHKNIKFYFSFFVHFSQHSLVPCYPEMLIWSLRSVASAAGITNLYALYLCCSNFEVSE